MTRRLKRTSLARKPRKQRQRFPMWLIVRNVLANAVKNINQYRLLLVAPLPQARNTLRRDPRCGHCVAILIILCLAATVLRYVRWTL